MRVGLGTGPADFFRRGLFRLDCCPFALFLRGSSGPEEGNSVLGQEDELDEAAGLVISLLLRQCYAEPREKQALESRNLLRIGRGQFHGQPGRNAWCVWKRGFGMGKGGAAHAAHPAKTDHTPQEALRP